MRAIARLKVTLKNVEPKVRRHSEVPIDITLDRLHDVLMSAVGLERQSSLRNPRRRYEMGYAYRGRGRGIVCLRIC
jgi:hypothetical protein